jgi:hypothetical protein
MALIRSKTFLKISALKFGSNEKLFQSLHPQITNMLRIQLHIESMNWFSRERDYTICGARNAAG